MGRAHKGLKTESLMGAVLDKFNELANTWQIWCKYEGIYFSQKNRKRGVYFKW